MRSGLLRRLRLVVILLDCPRDVYMFNPLEGSYIYYTGVSAVGNAKSKKIYSVAKWQ